MGARRPLDLHFARSARAPGRSAGVRTSGLRRRPPSRYPAAMRPNRTSDPVPHLSRPGLRLAIAAVAASVVVGTAGCQNRKVKVEIGASGEVASRSFATNETDARALEAVAATYGSKGESDGELGRRFTGSFAEDALPSEIGNRGAIGRLDSSLGSARAYYEQFAGRRDEWTAMRDRVESGLLWMRLFGRYVERRQLKDEARREEFSRWWNGEMIPFVADAYLMYSGMQAVVQSQRIGALPRRPDDFSPRTGDELFRLQVFEPLAILMAERGFLSADEFAAVQVVAADGNFSRREREWASAKVLGPAVARLVARFDPGRGEMKLGDFVPIAIDFVLWTKLSREYRDLVLESPAVPEATKAEIRRGKWDFELPPPFGFRTMSRPAVTEAEVLLETGARPYFTNGVWNEAIRRIEFKGGFYEEKHRYAPYSAPYYAFWALPSQRQESAFGAVILEGEALAEYCAWEAALDDAARPRWTSALDALAATKDAAPAHAMLLELAPSHPMPIALARWICERVAKPLPAPYSATGAGDLPGPGADAARPSKEAGAAPEAS